MRDQFLIDFCDSQQNYDETVSYLIKHHPTCVNDTEADANWKKEFVTNLVNDAIRRIMFGNLDYFAYIPNMLVAVRLDEKTVLLSVTPR